MTPLGMRARSRLILPLAALFVAFFLTPLCMLIGLSLSTSNQVRPTTLAHYVRLFSDPFNYAILFDTLLLGVKATLACLVFGYPVAWICARASARWQSVLVFLVILPISWIVILGRRGILNQIAMGLGLTEEPLGLLFTRPASSWCWLRCRCR